MAEYRDDLGAARMRIETLEAKLAERDAALHAREAEIAERDAEIASLRKIKGVVAQGPATGRVALVVGLFVILVMTGAVAMVSTRRAAPPAAPAAGPVVEGKATPDEPMRPPATAGGEARGAENAEGNLSTAVQQALEDARPKVKACYERERKEHPSAEGFLRAVFEVGSDGRISHVRYSALTQFDKPWWSKDLETCMTRTLQSIEIPSSGKGPVTGEKMWFLTPAYLLLP